MSKHITFIGSDADRIEVENLISEMVKLDSDISASFKVPSDEDALSENVVLFITPNTGEEVFNITKVRKDNGLATVNYFARPTPIDITAKRTIGGNKSVFVSISSDSAIPELMSLLHFGDNGISAGAVNGTYEVPVDTVSDNQSINYDDYGYDEPESNGKKVWIIIAVVLIVAVVAFFGYNEIPGDADDGEIPVDIVVSDTMAVDTTIVEETMPVVEVDQDYTPYPSDLVYLSGNFYDSPVHVLLNLADNVGALYFVNNPDIGYVLFSIQNYYRDIDGHIAFKDVNGDESSQGIFVGTLDTNGFRGMFRTPLDETRPTEPVEFIPIDSESTTFPDLTSLSQMVEDAINGNS